MKDKKMKIIRRNKFDFRMSDEESSDLGYMSYKTGKTRSEVIREALRVYKNIVKNQ